MLDNINSRAKFARTISLLIALCLLGACATTVTVEAEIPNPLIEPLPLNGKMILSDEFKNFVYTEKEKGRSLNRMTFGTAQTVMFNTIFGRLLNLDAGSGVIADIMIEPELLDFEYSAPRETKLKLYEVFLKYRLKLSDKNNQKLADWTIKGYGKTPTATLSSAATAFNAAANVALRDVGAQLATRFPVQSSIVGLLPAATEAESTATTKPAAEPGKTDSELKAQIEPQLEAKTKARAESGEAQKLGEDDE